MELYNFKLGEKCLSRSKALGFFVEESLYRRVSIFSDMYMWIFQMISDHVSYTFMCIFGYFDHKSSAYRRHHEKCQWKDQVNEDIGKLKNFFLFYLQH